MEDSAGNIELRRIENSLAANRLLFSCLRLRNAVKYNPDWFLQPRAPADSPGGIGGQWVPSSNGLPQLFQVGQRAMEILARVANRVSPYLRRTPKFWEDSIDLPANDLFDEETGRIGPETARRPGHQSLRFRNERELRRYLGPAGRNREWHHIVEKRLAEKGIFPPEQIHSTDNIINLPTDVHRCVSRIMSEKDPMVDNTVMRFWVEKLPFDKQYNHGIRLILRCFKELGYDPNSF
ncbi:hypothetical protein M1D80_14860 [Phyllobacteriaceae bacterium JZ32]